MDTKTIIDTLVTDRTQADTAYPALYAVLGGTTLPSISYSSDTTTYIKMADD